MTKKTHLLAPETRVTFLTLSQGQKRTIRPMLVMTENENFRQEEITSAGEDRERQYLPRSIVYCIPTGAFVHVTRGRGYPCPSAPPPSSRPKTYRLCRTVRFRRDAAVPSRTRAFPPRLSLSSSDKTICASWRWPCCEHLRCPWPHRLPRQPPRRDRARGCGSAPVPRVVWLRLRLQVVVLRMMILVPPPLAGLVARKREEAHDGVCRRNVEPVWVSRERREIEPVSRVPWEPETWLARKRVLPRDRTGASWWWTWTTKTKTKMGVS